MPVQTKAHPLTGPFQLKIPRPLTRLPALRVGSQGLLEVRGGGLAVAAGFLDPPKKHVRLGTQRAQQLQALGVGLRTLRVP